jgi:hypothetical protein
MPHTDSMVDLQKLQELEQRVRGTPNQTCSARTCTMQQPVHASNESVLRFPVSIALDCKELRSRCGCHS